MVSGAPGTVLGYVGLALQSALSLLGIFAGIDNAQAETLQSTDEQQRRRMLLLKLRHQERSRRRSCSKVGPGPHSPWFRDQTLRAVPEPNLTEYIFSYWKKGEQNRLC